MAVLVSFVKSSVVPLSSWLLRLATRFPIRFGKRTKIQRFIRKKCMQNLKWRYLLKGKWGDKNQFFLKDSLLTVFRDVPTIYHWTDFVSITTYKGFYILCMEERGQASEGSSLRKPSLKNRMGLLLSFELCK